MSTVTITASNLNVRATPSTDAAVLAQLARDATVEKVSASPDGQWFQVRTPAGTSGWIAAKYAVENAAPAAAAPVSLSINADRLNVRATPSTDAAVLAQVTRGTTVQKLAASPDGQWFQVSAAGVTGWISAQYAVPAAASTPVVSGVSAAPASAPAAAPSALAGETLAYRCLALTAGFETEVMPPECFAGLAGDFDGQGMSLGVLQWNLGQGTLQPLLLQVDRESPAAVQAAMGDGLAEFRAFLGKSKSEQMAWARSKQASNKWQEPWRSRFKALGRSAEMQKIQVAGAGDRYQRGLALVQQYGLWSERAAALMFDIVVQNGSIKDATRQQILADFARIDPSLPKADQEVLKMRAVANRRAEAASAKYVEDVRSRKLAIANGSGTVHGAKYDLEKTYGIRLVPIA